MSSTQFSLFNETSEAMTQVRMPVKDTLRERLFRRWVRIDNVNHLYALGVLFAATKGVSVDELAKRIAGAGGDEMSELDCLRQAQRRRVAGPAEWNASTVGALLDAMEDLNCHYLGGCLRPLA